jgi:hypothetical protein
MPPVLQRLITIGIGVRFGLLFLGQMPLVVGRNTSHVRDIILVIFGGVFLWVLLQDFDNFASASDNQHEVPTGRGIALPGMTYTFAGTCIVAPTRLFGRVTFQPVFELFGRHVYCGVEVPIKHVRKPLDRLELPENTYLMTSSSLFTIAAVPGWNLRLEDRSCTTRRFGSDNLCMYQTTGDMLNTNLCNN